MRNGIVLSYAMTHGMFFFAENQRHKDHINVVLVADVVQSMRKQHKANLNLHQPQYAIHNVIGFIYHFALVFLLSVHCDDATFAHYMAPKFLIIL